MRHRTLFLYFILGLFGYFLSCGPKGEQLPNIVLIFIDDLGYADVSSFGATTYQTPHIDRLGEEGISFTSFYASQAVCSASRASLLTGCYADRVGIQGALGPNAAIGINPEELLIPEMLKEKGYATGIFGKWHLGHHREFLPLQNGFDEYLGLPYSNDMWPVGFDGVPLVNPEHRKSIYPPLLLIDGNDPVDTIQDLNDQAILTKTYTARAIDFIKRHRNSPFFLYMPHSMVHVPIAASKEFLGKSGKGLFADVMQELDWSVGEIMRTLEEQGLDDRTLVIFTSDNGPWLNFGNHAGSALPLREGKGNMWEGGVRVPTLMRWPNQIPPSITTDALASTVDILPTLAEITGADLPTHKIDGISILPLLKGGNKSPRESFFYYYERDLIAVRNARWKLVFPHSYRSYVGVEPGKDGFPGPYAKGVVDSMELYDLQSDISEVNNVVAEYPEVVAELDSLANQMRYLLGDRLTSVEGQENRSPGRRHQEFQSVDHLAVGKSIEFRTAYSSQYSGEGDQTLVNGKLGSFDHTDGQWLGFEGNDMDVLIDLGGIVAINEVAAGFLVNQGSWIFAPRGLRVSLSEDGLEYEMVREIIKEESIGKGENVLEKLVLQIGGERARFIRFEALNIGQCPEWHPGAGGKAWVFLDELVVL